MNSPIQKPQIFALLTEGPRDQPNRVTLVELLGQADIQYFYKLRNVKTEEELTAHEQNIKLYWL